MSLVYNYNSIQFFSITFICTWIPWFIAAHFSHQVGGAKFQLPLMFMGLLAPCAVALGMIYASKNAALINDFWNRLLLFRVNWSTLLFIFVGLPIVFFLATALSLIFGKSMGQFTLASEIKVMKGWPILSLLIPLALAPALEEIGWRGYGIDSLRNNFNLFYTSLLFAGLWALWHLPLFFIKGYYQYELRSLNVIYIVNFFISIIPVAIITNWIFYNNCRSILLVIVVHAIFNGLSILFKTEQFTKCLFTLLLCGLSTIIVLKEREFFFKPSLNQLIRKELTSLRHLYNFPGASCTYILPDGKIDTIAIGMADVEKNMRMMPHTRMLAASIGKSFVAATILQLAGQGQLNLEDKISKWLGDYPWFSRLPNHSSITVRHLLNHSSGLPDHVHMPAFIEAFSYQGESGNLFQPESLITFVLDHQALFEPGHGWKYTDTGYILLGLIIETVAQNSYYSELERRFLSPLNLKETGPSNKRKLSRLAAGYTMVNNTYHLPSKSLDQSDEMAWNPVIEWTGGGLISSSKDLAVWAKLLFEGHAMEEEYLADLLKRVFIEKGSDHYYGSGVTISDKDSFGVAYGHFGIIPGYTSCMRYFPEHKVTFAFQINTDVGIADHSTKLLEEMIESLSNMLL